MSKVGSSDSQASGSENIGEPPKEPSRRGAPSKIPSRRAGAKDRNVPSSRRGTSPEPAPGGRRRTIEEIKVKSRKLSNSTLFKKYFVFGVNVVVLIAGVALTVIGIQSFSANAGFEGVTGKMTRMGGLAIAVLGGIICFVAFIGALGALLRSKTLLIIYCVLLVILFLLVVAASVGVLVFQKNPALVKNQMSTSMGAYQDEQIQKEWDILQIGMTCCGIMDNEGVNEWESAHKAFTRKYFGKSWRNIPGISAVPGIVDVSDEEARETLKKSQGPPSERPTTPLLPQNTLTPRARYWRAIETTPNPEMTSFSTPSPKEVTLWALEDLLRSSRTLRDSLNHYFDPPVPVTCCTNPKAYSFKREEDNSTASEDFINGNETITTPASGSLITHPPSINDLPPDLCSKDKKEDIWERGCLDKILNKLATIGKIALGLSSLLILGIIMAICVIATKKKGEKRRRLSSF